MEGPATVVARAAFRGDTALDVAVTAQLVQDGGELAPGVPAICVAGNFSSVPVVQSLIAAGLTFVRTTPETLSCARLPPNVQQPN